ncbi:hypothetical protein MINTM019_13150 [Mycobacterium paraintracellulare]|nr:hypothetical protein MINTM019_13150 [Mycobacterium paraintracellulare]
MAGPATDSAVAMALLPSARQLVPIEGYMKSCVGGVSAPNPGAAAVGAASGAGAGAGAASGRGRRRGGGCGPGRVRRVDAGRQVRLGCRLGCGTRRVHRVDPGRQVRLRTGFHPGRRNVLHRRGGLLDELIHRRRHVFGLAGSGRAVGEGLRGGHEQLCRLLRVAGRLLDERAELRQGRQPRQLLGRAGLWCRLRRRRVGCRARAKPERGNRCRDDSGQTFGQIPSGCHGCPSVLSGGLGR